MAADDAAASSARSFAIEPFYRRAVEWARRNEIERKLSIVLLAMALGCGIATYLSMSGSLGIRVNPRTVLLLLIVDLIVLLLLGAVVARRLVVLWAERRRGLAGARLHARLVLLFSLVAVAPTIIVALF